MKKTQKQTQREFVTNRLNELYNEKWRSLGKTQKQFTEAIRFKDPQCGITEQYVSRLLSGKYIPQQKYLSVICKVLDVNISDFFPKSHDDRYQYSSDYANELEGKLEDYASKYFKIDLTFFQGLRNIIPNFDEKFPLYRPLTWYDITSQHKPYERTVAAEAAVTTSKGQGLFQIVKGNQQDNSEDDNDVGTCYFLSKYDMKFIREIQDEISRLVQQKFIARTEALKATEEEANEEYWKKLMKYNPYYDEDHTIWETYQFGDDELQSIDKAGIYSDKEAKRLHLPQNWRDPLIAEEKEAPRDE